MVQIRVGYNKGSEVGAFVAALNGFWTCRGVEVGEIVGETKTFVLLADGWKCPVSEEDGVKKRCGVVDERGGEIGTQGEGRDT